MVKWTKLRGLPHKVLHIYRVNIVTWQFMSKVDNSTFKWLCKSLRYDLDTKSDPSPPNIDVIGRPWSHQCGHCQSGSVFMVLMAGRIAKKYVVYEVADFFNLCIKYVSADANIPLQASYHQLRQAESRAILWSCFIGLSTMLFIPMQECHTCNGKKWRQLSFTNLIKFSGANPGWVHNSSQTETSGNSWLGFTGVQVKPLLLFGLLWNFLSNVILCRGPSVSSLHLKLPELRTRWEPHKCKLSLVTFS